MTPPLHCVTTKKEPNRKQFRVVYNEDNEILCKILVEPDKISQWVEHFGRP